MKSLYLVLMVGGMWLATSLSAAAEVGQGGDLASQFHTPPDSARPWVYWIWLNGNITSEGITANLEAMRRVGIGGVLIMEVDQGAPVGPVAFMGPQWRELFKHVAAEASRLGLEVNMNDDAGWNGSGGPWIKPEQAMQTPGVDGNARRRRPTFRGQAAAADRHRRLLPRHGRAGDACPAGRNGDDECGQTAADDQRTSRRSASSDYVAGSQARQAAIHPGRVSAAGRRNAAWRLCSRTSKVFMARRSMC